MKLIKEYCEQVKTVITEAKDTKAKAYFIEGIFMQADKQNKNGRVYPKEVMENELARYVKEQVDAKRAVGELGHPDTPTINYDRVSHLITSLKMDGTNVIGKAKILDNTPMGMIVRSFMDEGIQMGCSSRALGSVVENYNGVQEVQNDFTLAAVDIVHDPSAPEAFVQGIMEGREWHMNNGVIVSRAVEKLKKSIKTDPVKNAKLFEEKMLNDFYKFMTILSKA